MSRTSENIPGGSELTYQLQFLMNIRSIAQLPHPMWFQIVLMSSAYSTACEEHVKLLIRIWGRQSFLIKHPFQESANLHKEELEAN